MTVEEYINLHSNYKEELTQLRGILLNCDLKETIKWNAPVYTYNDKNIVGIGAFKSYFGLWFYQGALFKDPNGYLINAQEGKTAALRQWRFTNKGEINETIVKEYVNEAIKNQKLGKEIKPKKKPLVIPDLLTEEFNTCDALRNSFESLSLTHKREFVDYITEAKREQTKIDRLEKIKPLILEGIGLHDKYRK